MANAIHFKNYLGPGTLCGIFDPTPGTVITSQPDQVTCEQCLARMGRAKRPPGRDADAAA